MFCQTGIRGNRIVSRVHGRFYPVPTQKSIRLAPLPEEATGISWLWIETPSKACFGSFGQWDILFDGLESADLDLQDAGDPHLR